MAKTITIEFEDHGQDFLLWDVEEGTGKVLDCHPFQGWLWCKGYVTNLQGLDIGDKVQYLSLSTGAIAIKYPVASIAEKETP